MPGEGKFAALFGVIHMVAGTCLHGLVHEGMQPAWRGIGIRCPYRLADQHGGRFEKLAGGSDSRRRN